jgi:Lrp/AsnC family transcriptional regulator, leucine-responsive regulatory protein
LKYILNFCFYFEGVVRMDVIDVKLLELLQRNSRMTVSELSKRLALSRPSVSERLHRLQHSGIIEEFSARISLSKVGLDIQLFIQIGDLKKSPAEIEKFIEKEEGIIEAHRVTGTSGYILKAAVPDMAKMRMLIDRLMPFGALTTSVILASPVPHRHVTIEAD